MNRIRSYSKITNSIQLLFYWLKKKKNENNISLQVHISLKINIIRTYNNRFFGLTLMKTG